MNNQLHRVSAAGSGCARIGQNGYGGQRPAAEPLESRRLLSAALDPTFGTHGVASLPGVGPYTQIRAMDVRGGKAVLALQNDNPDDDTDVGPISFVRLDASGRPDPTSPATPSSARNSTPAATRPSPSPG